MTKFSAFQPAQDLQSDNAMQKKEESSLSGQMYNRYCTKCGAQLEEDDLFCSECVSKIEEEEKVAATDEDAVVQEQAPFNISSDRMASVLDTNRIKSGETVENMKKFVLPFVSDKNESKNLSVRQNAVQKSSLIGHYMRMDAQMTQYLVIDAVQGTSVKASVKTIFNAGGFSIEFYEGTLSGNNLSLHMVNADMHPLPDEVHVLFGETRTVHHSIKRSEEFDGLFQNDTISGAFSGEFSTLAIFRKC